MIKHRTSYRRLYQRLGRSAWRAWRIPPEQFITELQHHVYRRLRWLHYEAAHSSMDRQFKLAREIRGLRAVYDQILRYNRVEDVYLQGSNPRGSHNEPW